eukprot:scaffold21894_cov141-Isochrysis_galbana.AAC.2
MCGLPFFSLLLPSSPSRVGVGGGGWTMDGPMADVDGGRMQRVPPTRHHYVFWFGTVPMHTPTHSSTTGHASSLMQKSTPLFLLSSLPPPACPVVVELCNGCSDDEPK